MERGCEYCFTVLHAIIFTSFQGPFSLLSFAQIQEVILPASAAHPTWGELALITIQSFALGDDRHPVLDMPAMHHTSEFVILKSEVHCSVKTS
jgi:1-deoxy-D-xylulose 5-phosphate reductoisomerase